MTFQAVFMRYELKYMLTREQKQRILEAMSSHMELDQYGRTTIRNLYFDTKNFGLIRRSIEKPAYKEKLRIRSYDLATATVKMPVALNSLVVVLGSNSPSIITESSTSQALDENGVAWN